VAAPDLDLWLPDPQVRIRHRRVASADPERLWEAAGAVRVRDAPRLGRIVRWRIPETSPDERFRVLFGRYPFTVLSEGAQCSVSGLCGRIWTVQRDYPRLSGPEEFLDWAQPGTVRVLFAHWVEPAAGDEGSTLVSEARVEPVDRRAGLRMRAVWTVVGRFERLIGGEALEAATRRAEAA
jgi:hypothetical protein